MVWRGVNADMAMALNVIVALLELWAFRKVWNRKWMNLVFYTQISNILTFVSSLAFLAFGRGAVMLRYTSVCMMVMTALVTVFILVPMGGDPKKLLWSGNGLYHHVICPLITTVSYVFFEPHAGFSFLWLPVGVTLLYGLVMLALNGKELVDGPYPFFRVRHQSPGATVVWTIALVGLMAAISALVGLAAG